MEANKYYTPKVEEFHVGFEFEVLQFLGKPIFDKADGSVDLSTVEHTWLLRKVKFLSDVSENFCVVYSGGEKTQESISNSIRVKYLDKEDIESLGFEKLQTKSYEKLKFINRNKYSRDECIHFEDKVVDGLGKYIAVENNCGDFYFKGFIKNKSELRKLMYQLNILEDEK